MTNENNYPIREATLNDLDRIIEIWKHGLDKAFGTTSLDLKIDSNNISQTFKQYINSQTDVFKFWVYLNKDNEIIAWCSILPFHPNPILRNSWGMVSMYIDNDYQNKIYGYLFSRFVLNFASETTLRYIISIVSNENSRIIKLAKKMGFITIGVLPQNMKDNELPLTELMIFEA